MGRGSTHLPAGLNFSQRGRMYLFSRWANWGSPRFSDSLRQKQTFSSGGQDIQQSMLLHFCSLMLCSDVFLSRSHLTPES